MPVDDARPIASDPLSRHLSPPQARCQSQASTVAPRGERRSQNSWRIPARQGRCRTCMTALASNSRSIAATPDGVRQQ